MTNILPNGNNNDGDELFKTFRRIRKAQGLTQAELAAISGVGQRFLSELENGKQSLELGRVLRVASALGLRIRLEPKTWEPP